MKTDALELAKLLFVVKFCKKITCVDILPRKLAKFGTKWYEMMFPYFPTCVELKRRGTNEMSCWQASHIFR